MEKIEKLEEFNWVSGRDAITIALCNTIIRKQNEIIDHLNSQVQPEEKECECCKWDDMGYTHEPYCPLFKEYKQDTPEEWEDRIRDLILDISADRLVSSEKVVAIVQSLLNDRERKAREDIIAEISRTKIPRWN